MPLRASIRIVLSLTILEHRRSICSTFSTSPTLPGSDMTFWEYTTTGLAWLLTRPVHSAVEPEWMTTTRSNVLGSVDTQLTTSSVGTGRLGVKCHEAHFWLNGYVNKQNCRIWSEANPQVYVETPLHPEKLTVWCALWAGGIIGLYFFKNDEGHNVTVNDDRYRAMITNFFIPELNNQDVQEQWFQQDGATCHTARATIDILKDTFGDRLISRFGPVNWPPRSCDLTPLDYFLWGYVKSLVYADKPQTLDHLEDNIRRVIADIRPQMLEKVIENWTTSEPAVAVLCQKSYLKCNATRLFRIKKFMSIE
ncbi:transposable element Tc3 transposase [Trichonephila clavipes]|nr:transposable element Tc3 transposase [Trichonephila clavipes]